LTLDGVGGILWETEPIECSPLPWKKREKEEEEFKDRKQNYWYVRKKKKSESCGLISLAQTRVGDEPVL
jgi:hypothetical protein